MALVMACALPLLVVMWKKDEPAFLAAELLGVATWIAVMAGLDAWLLRRGHHRASRALAPGAVAFAVIQAILGLISMDSMLYVYLPFMLMIDAGPSFLLPEPRFALILIFTIACGFNALLVVVLLAAAFLPFVRRPAIDEA